MKRVVVTPAGRRQYLEVLSNNMIREKSGFDEWHLWVNTNVPSDVSYCEQLERENPWVRLVRMDGINRVTSDNIHRFFVHAQDRDTVYVRLDDDVVYLENGFFDKFIPYRLENKKPFLIFANIINNAIVSHLHQRNGLIDNDVLCGYSCMDHLAWCDASYVEKLHRTFIEDVISGNIHLWHGSFKKWICYFYERVSINAISWLGEDMANLGGRVETHEELCLSSWLPEKLKRPCEIFGGAIAVHFAFGPQRVNLEKTDLLSVYKRMSE